MTALLEELAPEFGTAKVFRPYRDVRFSHDKTPYKTHQGAVVHPDGRGSGRLVRADLRRRAARVRWQLAAGDRPGRPLPAGRGRRRPGTATAGRGRPARVRRLGHRRREAQPGAAGYPADAERLELLKHKSLHATRSWEPTDWLHERRALDEVRDRLARSQDAEHLARRQRRRDDQGTPPPPLTVAAVCALTVGRFVH